ncbi:hypothetical protein BDZ89DRAFT_953942 [Hymenopellis radicata]|nr:hypothetical protein BDZ89DRAFT_953942 [Hymenopellis radicata]
MTINLQLVYRALRTISDWTVHGYYSELYVQGEENVPRDGPLIIASNHHNEILDVATLSVTIPSRRQLCFWTKSTLFRNPLSALILSSSGAIPVQRNPNGADGSSKAALFHSSTMAFANGKVIGVFPEGTSYTEPTIAQIMSGAAWAAVEYTRWQREAGRAVTKDAVIIPVGIVYTDKTRFRSSLRVQYGTPISMSEYVDELFHNPMGASVDDLAYGVVREITQRIEQQLFAMTINASDWETLYAAEPLRAIVYGRERKLSLKDWALITIWFRFIDLLSDPAPSEPLGHIKESLIKYYSLLRRTGLLHSDLPCIPSSSSRLRYLFNLALPSPRTIILAPLYLPTLLLHI